GYEKNARDQYGALDPPGQIQSIRWEHEEAPEGLLLGQMQFVRKGMGNLLPGGRLEVSPLAMIRQHNPFSSDDRHDPLLFHYAYLDDDTFTVAPPPGYVLEALPPGIDQQTGAGRYIVRVEKDASGAVLIRRQMALQRFVAPPEAYRAYRA